jgi:purine-binding chemotaxis protein CheW
MNESSTRHDRGARRADSSSTTGSANGNAAGSATNGASRGSATGASRPTGSNAATTSSGLKQSLCTFWLGERCFGLDVALVGEVVVVEATIPVPRAHEALLGLFNLRGTPVPLVDAARVLAFDGARAEGATHALVLRRGELVVALAIDRMEAVLEAGRGEFTPPSSGDEHPVVRGFLETGDRVVTVIAPEALLERLERLRPSAAER